MRTKSFILFTLFSTVQAAAQDIHFSQFYHAPLAQNPALAGAEYQSEAIVNYRSQWRSVADPYSTMAAMAHTRIGSRPGKNFFSLGALFFQDLSGDNRLRTLQAGLDLAYHVQIGREQKLGLGLMASYGQLSFDSQSFQWGSQYSGNAYDPSLNPGEDFGSSAYSYPDISSGLVWSYSGSAEKRKVQGNQYRSGSVGIAVYHLNRPEYSFFGSGQRLFPRLAVHGRFLFGLPDSKLALNPGFMYYRQGPNSEMLFGGMLRYDLISESKYTGVYKSAGVYLGAFLRSGDALVISSLFEFDLFSLGLSYDTNISALKTSSGGMGGLELALIYRGSKSWLGKTVKTR